MPLAIDEIRQIIDSIVLVKDTDKTIPISRRCVTGAQIVRSHLD